MSHAYFAFCWSSGLIQFGERVPNGALELCCGARTTVVREVTAAARHGLERVLAVRKKGQLLVPGVVEASTEALKYDALGVWLAWLGKRPQRFIVWARPDSTTDYSDPAVIKRVRDALDADIRAAAIKRAA